MNETKANNPPLVVENDPVPIRITEDGAVRIGMTRVSLATVVTYFNVGRTPEEIAASFTTLQLADIYSVIGYYLRHKNAVDAFLRWEDEEAERIRKKIEAYQNSDEFRAHQEAQRAMPRS